MSRRGAIEVPARYDATLRPGLAFMTLHFQDDVATNILTIDAIDPKSGTAEFKASAIRIEKLGLSRRISGASSRAREGSLGASRTVAAPRLELRAWTST